MKTLREYYTTVKDYPTPGILFRDLTTILQDKDGLQLAIDEMASFISEKDVDIILGIEARGFLFAPTLAYKLHKAFVPVRKAGKLPREVVQASYALEYGEATLEIHRDAIFKGARVVVVDDLLATGGTAKATATMVEELGGIVEGFVFLSELNYLEGRKKLEGYKVDTVVVFEE